MPVVQHTLLQLDGVTPMIGRKVTVGQVGAALSSGSQTVGSLDTLTDGSGNAQFTLAVSAPSSYYVWTDPDGTQYAFAVPSTGSGPFNLTDVLINPPGALPYVPVLTGVSQAALTAAVNALVAGAPGALDTLKELADALGDDPNFATTVTTALANRLRFDTGQTLTSGQLTQAQANLGLTALLSNYAPLAAPALTGNATVQGLPIATVGTDSYGGIHLYANGLEL